nr:DUF3794 domain-containing protein [uncultured Agathobaculum sp.]
MELNQTSICYYDKRMDRIVTCTETADTIVPDTFPDVGRVICAYGTAAVKDQTPQSGRLLISGMVQAVILYEPEGGGLRRLTVPISFAHIEECEGVDAESVCLVACRTAAVDAAAVNSRKLSVTVQLCFAIECYCKTECTITEEIALPGIQMRSTMQPLSLIEQARTYPITVLDDVNLQEASGLSMLHTSCTVKVSECRAIRGKAVLKGEAAVQCLALQEDDAVRVLTSSTPFTQILELPDAEEGDAASAQVTVLEADCRLEADGLLSYTVSASALITLRHMRAVRQIEDLYLPGAALQIQMEKKTLRTMPPLTPFAAEASDTVPTEQHVSHVISAGACCCSAKRGEDNTLQITAAVQVLYLGDDQQLCFLQRMLPLSMACAASGEISQIELTARASSAGEKGMLLTIAAAGMTSPVESFVFSHISSIETEKSAMGEDGVTLRLRYIDREQQLWDIAKECGATMDAIRRANDLAEDASAVSNTMLLIPIQV